MARYSGRNCALYVSVDGVAAPTVVPFIKEYEVSAAVDKLDVTAGGDQNKVYVAGLPDFDGSVSGFWEYASTAATDAFWAASRDGLPRNFYLYPNSATPTFYFYGSAYFDFTHSAGVDAPGTVASDIVAAGNISRKP